MVKGYALQVVTSKKHLLTPWCVMVAKSNDAHQLAFSHRDLDQSENGRWRVVTTWQSGAARSDLKYYHVTTTPLQQAEDVGVRLQAEVDLVADTDQGAAALQANETLAGF